MYLSAQTYEYLHSKSCNFNGRERGQTPDPRLYLKGLRAGVDFEVEPCPGYRIALSVLSGDRSAGIDILSHTVHTYDAVRV